MVNTMMPEPMTTRQKGRPRDFWLVASLFKFPSILMPRTTMARPRKLKLWELLNTGQLVWYQFLKTEHSEMTRNTIAVSEGHKDNEQMNILLDIAVRIWVAPSKKKNLTPVSLCIIPD
jgi:hypothetical protein